MENVTSNPVDAGQAEVVEPQVVVEQVTEQPDNSVTPEPAEPERAKQTPEENAMFAKVRRDAEEKARVKAEDDVIARLYGESHGIKTMAEYNAAIEAQKEAERIAELEERGIEPDYLKSLIENDPDVKEARKIKSEKKNHDDFLNYFKKENGRDYDATKDVIPMEVWELTFKGIPLKEAYEGSEKQMLRVKNEQLLAELNAIKSGKSAEEVNQKNAARATGAIGTNGATANEGFISAETFEQNRGNMDWVKKNLERITKSRKTW